MTLLTVGLALGEEAAKVVGNGARMAISGRSAVAGEPRLTLSQGHIVSSAYWPNVLFAVIVPLTTVNAGPATPGAGDT